MTHVYLIGAGPGDPELLTLKGRRHLETADIIIYDRLVNPTLLHLAKKGAEFLYCGKLPRHHTMRQEQINAAIVANAVQGKKVVRLKGGDPAIFGRVGEEMKAISDAGFTYQVIPGITSSSAASIYAGIPLTHRDHNGHVTFATGHQKNNALTEIDMNNLLQGGTLAFYMGIENLSHICEKLIRQPALTKLPIAIIEWGTLGRQKVLTGSVDTIEAALAKTMLANPAMIIIGHVVTERTAPSWFEQQPLFGKRYLLASERGFTFEQICEYIELGAHIYAFPSLNTKDTRFDDITTRVLTEQNWDGILLHDGTPVRILQEELARLGINETFHIFQNNDAHVILGECSQGGMTFDERTRYSK
ncbi:bifunctional uroporphyrinogen-III methyltransferase/uroporphyrinogen-III synthase [Listeria grandensis FSL F6-0971]|uniref:Uroporphyrinogen-III C-methyltransferase n=1 Tax=Listeria grandensis FSL F6-0971 TaxID=1265819 RepID=W7BDR8_9LIST|nr:uroporphyrinogen-III C-methyltransferase [Listeria grandensis]EUJ21276.1 bifunctional uroporphyrinogen-III methyltransferase/uroporphyrinogen-III synthase [Listeria grandensis FSL F6-0971]